jgi:hypothetical protein
MTVSRSMQQVASHITCLVRIQPLVLIKPFDPQVKDYFSYTPAVGFMR